jgi:hypothetical protein
LRKGEKKMAADEGSVRLWILDQTEFMDAAQREQWLTNEIVRLRRIVDSLNEKGVPEDQLSVPFKEVSDGCNGDHDFGPDCGFHILAG